jgi:hypothetical protein
VNGVIIRAKIMLDMLYVNYFLGEGVSRTPFPFCEGVIMKTQGLFAKLDIYGSEKL